jgi:hypothetical protein
MSRGLQFNLTRFIYFGGSFLWVLYVLVFPTWMGRISHGGTFGLTGSGVAPIWRPPTGHGALTNAPVRLPGQTRIGDRIEFDWGHIFHRWSAGVIILGFIVAAINLFRPLPSSVLPAVALAISVSLAIALLMTSFLMTMGALGTDVVVVSVYLLALLAGLAVGCWAHAVVAKIRRNRQ